MATAKRSTLLDRRAFGRRLAGALGIAAFGCRGPERPGDTPAATQGSTGPTGDPPRPDATGEPPAPDDAPPPKAPRVDLAAAIGQMLLVGFRGLRAGGDDPVLRDLEEHHLGGVLLFDRDDALGRRSRNIRSPRQLRALCGELRAAAAGKETPLIAIDQEGGYVNRLLTRKGFPETVTARRLGRIDRVARTEAAAATIAGTLADAGINVNLAPVVDLMVHSKNPIIGAVERSFSADPEVVTRHARAFIRAHHARGILCAIKHFPGHGSSRDDSHQGFVDITDTWSERELDPFRAIIAAGEADAVMTGHLFHSGLDPEVPATLSREVVTGLLRGRLGFAGPVLSDDLQMAAITDNYGPAEALRRAIAAGVDILVIGNNVTYDPDCVPRTVETIAEHVARGRLEVARVEEAAARVAALKARLRS